jgi:class 3 adenylate cyclase
VTFQVNPSIREVPRQHYCLAEPAFKAHIKVQQPVEPGQVRTVTTSLSPGRYRMRLAGSNAFRILDITVGAAEQAIGWTAGDDGPVVAAPSPVVTFENKGAKLLTFIIEDAKWADDAIRPAQLFNMQEFRDLFAAEYVAADVQLSVGEQVILFSDIVSSTEFYEIHGDAKAFAEVRRHFREVYEEVRNHHGAVVKTIGDAAMAAFHNRVDALKAARALLARFPSDPQGGGIRLRIAINAGSCIAVNLNSDIDYFGQSVNIAAKLQSCAGAGQIAFPKALCDDPRVVQFFDSEEVHLQEVTLALPSIKKPIEVLVWELK